MNTVLDPTLVERFREVLSRRLGLAFEDARLPHLAEVLRRRAEALGLDSGGYVDRLSRVPPREELGALSQTLTITETYFFRNLEQFSAFREKALPDLLARRGGMRRIRILSAGCASGEEAYSLAICTREAVSDPSWEVIVRGVDVNPAMIEKARSAKYSTWALRETPADVQRRWFRADGRDFVLDESVRGAVRLEQRNLAEDDPDLWSAGVYDVVFCRNVLMYFTPEGMRGLASLIARSLAPGGYLFLGHAETLRGLSNDFHLLHTHGTFYYQRKDGPGSPALPTLPADRREGRPLCHLSAVPEVGDTWVDAIRRASERIRTLTECHREPAGSPVAGAVPPGRSWDVGEGFDLLRQERFAAALEVVRAYPEEAGRDPDSILLHAILLTQSGSLPKAEEACRRLLEVDELNAGAHYLLALCREGAGEPEAAAEHDRIALYLDPGFAMPRLHLGLLARRAGDLETAKRELADARALLQLEGASRLLLFGGGFHRDALIAVCDAEIRSCGRSS